MLSKEWVNNYNSIKKNFDCHIELDSYFSEAKIGKTDVDVLDIGTVHFPTGNVIACDPIVEFGYNSPFIQKIPAGTYPVKICVVPSEEYGDRYACVKIEISTQSPVRYEIGMTREENLDEEFENMGFSISIDSALGCILDIQTQNEWWKYIKKCYEKEANFDPYDSIYDILQENAKINPLYQDELGNWANWTIPGTNCNIAMFSSGWGDGTYACYFGYDKDNIISGLYILFIDIENEYSEISSTLTNQSSENTDVSSPKKTLSDLGRFLLSKLAGKKNNK